MTDLPEQEGYDAGLSIGAYMKAEREQGDSSYDVRWDLADAAKQGHAYFAGFKRGLEVGLREGVAP
ncbi:MAG: hypothetical protein ACXVYY_01210 [Oryzihumus sp.]